MNLYKVGFIVLLGLYGLWGSLNPLEHFAFLHRVDLLIHEAGHVVFSFMGKFIQFLGGPSCRS